MLGKYKGFYVPRKESCRDILNAKNVRQVFCFKSNQKDCQDITDEGDCRLCLFYVSSYGFQEESFNIWHAAKGKVPYA